MTGIYCSIITPLVRKIAEEYNKIQPNHLSDAYVNNMISVWLSAQRTSNMPTANDLKKYFIDSGLSLRMEDAYFAIPRHLFVDYNPADPALTKTNVPAGNMITIQRLPNNNPLGAFFNTFKNHPELQNVIETTEEAYNFLLWRELYFIMYGDTFMKHKQKEAFDFAYKKAKKWKLKHPIRVVQEDTNNNPQPSNSLPLLTQPQLLATPKEYKVEYKKNGLTYTVREDSDGVHILNKNNEEVFKGEDDGNRRMILAKLELQRGAVTVNYNDNVFIVKPDGEILSGTDGRVVYQLNSDKLREDIHKLAEEKKQWYADQLALMQNLPLRNTEPINIYAGTNENADLSNFAIRPFSLLESRLYTKSTLFFVFHPFLPEKFQSVELGFLYVKLLVALSKTDWASDYLGDSQVDKTSASYKRGEKIYEVLNSILNTTDGAKLRRLGKSILLTPEEIKEWDNMSSVAMYELLKQSFRLNDNAAARLLKTGNATLTHKQDTSKWGTEFPRILMEVREELRNELPELELKEREKATIIEATIAPYRQASYDDYLKMSDEDLKKMRMSFSSASKLIANALGLELDTSLTSINIGGYEFNDGNESIVEPSFTFRFKNATFELVRLFSALMADLGYESQESNVTAQEVDIKDGDGVKYSIKINNVLSALESLSKVGIKNFTLDKQNSAISVLSFDSSDVDKLDNLITELKNNNNGEGEIERTGVKSLLDSEADRRSLYETWLESKGLETQQTELRGIVQRALNRLNGIQEDIDDLENIERRARENMYNLPPQLPLSLETIGRPAPAGTTSVKNGLTIQGLMNKTFGNDKRPEVIANSTIDAIRRGERTATTRFGEVGNKKDHIDYWRERKVGDIVLFYDDNTNTAVYVRVTKELTLLPKHMTKELVEEWSKKEGWSVDYFLHYLSNRANQGKAWQMEYEYIGDAPISDVKKKAAPLYSMPSLTPELLLKEQQEAEALLATGEHVVPRVLRITASLANDPNYTPNIDISRVTEFRDNHRLGLTRDFTVQLLKDRTEQMARDFSDIVDSIVDDMLEERVERQNQIKKELDDLHRSGPLSGDNFAKYGKLRLEFDKLTSEIDTLNDAVFGRRFAINEYGLDNIWDDLKQRYQEYADITLELWEEDYGAERGAYMKASYEKILNNFDALLDDATLIIEGNENFRVVAKKVCRDNGPGEGGEIKNGGIVTDNIYEKELKDAALSDDEDGTRVTGNDGWSFLVRFVDPLTSLSRDVRKVIGNIVRKRPVIKKVKKGNTEVEETEWIPETDDLGNIRYLNSESVHAILISELSSMIDADDFIKDVLVWRGNKYVTERTFPALEALVDKYPWMTLIIELLKADDRLASKFFHDFRKDFIPYWMQVYYDASDNRMNNEISLLFLEKSEDNNKEGWKLLLVNKETALDSTMTQVTRNYELGNVLAAHSIYTASKEISNKDAQWVVGEVNSLMAELQEIDSDNYDVITLRIADVLRAVGFNANRHIVSALLRSKEGNISGTNLARQVLDAVRSIALNVQDMPKGSHLIDYFKLDGYFNTIAELIGVVSELDHVQSFRQFDKSYYSYSAPNYLDTSIKKLKNDDRRDLFLGQLFKRYSWFYKDNQWRNEWLRLIEEDEDIRFNLQTKEINNIKLDKDDNDAEYRNWDESKIRLGFVREFFSIGINPNGQNQYAWYNVPIFSDSPIAKFIKFKRYTGDNYREEIIGHLSEVVKLELERIKLVKDRKQGISENLQVLMSNFDKNGDKFNFFPELNDKERFNYDGKSFLERIAELVDDGKIEEIDALIESALSQIMEDNFQEFLDDFTDDDVRDITDYLKQEGAIVTEDGFEEALRNYFYNQAFATTLIIEITTTDLAYYKDDVDFQKRFKEVYASGNKLNTNSKYGKKIEIVVYLSDLVITSATYNDIKRSLNYAVEQGRIQSFDRDNILNKFKDINVADAQAYRSLQSMRSVLDMMGKWDDKMENAFNRFQNGDWNMEDFNVVWLTIKPFMFTQIDKPAYSKEYLDLMLADGRISRKEYNRMRKERIKVPHQNKNSEFLLLSTYAMVANSLGKSNKLKGLERFMKDNDIDVVQFESAVKAGCLGTIDISYSPTKLNDLYNNIGERLERVVKEDIRKKHLQKAKANTSGNNLLSMSSADIAAEVEKDFKKLSKFDVLKKGADLLLDSEEITQMQYNLWFESIEPTELEVYDILERSTKDSNGFREEVVHELPYDDYCVQLPTPEHLFDVHNAVFGSQFRNLIIADLPEDFEVTLVGKNGKLQKYNKRQIIDLYQANIVENLLEGYKKASDKFLNIRTLLSFLIDLVKGNPKYGRDILDALLIVTINDPNNNGLTIEVFNIPLDNPTTTMKILELITSVFKNNVTKQTINGGACILVSDFGLTKELQVLRDEKTGAILGIECYMPASSRKFYEPFMKEVTDKKTGKTHMELDIKNMPEDLRKVIGYRIPTEDKYSMAPLIIKGFLPLLNGSSIMLPADITLIAGSDFDVDKMFLMIPSFRVKKHYNMKEAWKQFYKKNPDIVELIEKSKQEWFESYIEGEIEDNPDLEGTLSIDDEELKKKYFKDIGAPDYEYVIGTKDKFEKWFNENKDTYYTHSTVEKLKYDLNKYPQEQDKKRRDNLLIDISYAILTHPDTALKINDPGNFDKAKLGARIDAIITDKDLLTKFVLKYNIMGNALNQAKEEGRRISSTSDIVGPVAKFINKMAEEGKLDELNEFIKDNRKQRSQLTLNTFIYNHRLNMTGGALIGMYANNTTMLAKFQASDLRAKDHRSFIINGRLLNSLHDAYSLTGERISKNCANFSAASVDNVKDPVLADLLQNRKTANITSLMLRAGMTVNEISLVFSLPDIRKKIKGKEGLTPQTLGSLVSELKEQLELLLGPLPSHTDILKSYSVTSESLMEQTIRDTMEVLKYMDESMLEASDEVRATWNKERLEWEVERFKTLVVISNIVELSEPLGDLTRISRADSPNGAIATSIAGASIQRQKILRFALLATQREFPLLGTENIMQMQYLKPDMTIDEMRTKLLKHRMPMLQAFYSLGIDLAFDAMSEHFSLASPFMQDLATDLMINARNGYVKDWAVNRFFNESVTYALSKTKLFGDDAETGDTYELKREYYLYQFPKKFEKILIDNPDLKQIDIIKKLSVNSETGDIEMYRSGRMTPLMREALMRSMDLLLFDKDNPEALNLAVSLFMYAYYKDGFRFGPNSFGTFFSSNFIALFPDVVNTLRTLKFLMREGTFMDEYMPLFYANHVSDAGLPTVGAFEFLNGIAHIEENGDLVMRASNAVNLLTKGGFHPVTGKVLNAHYEYFDVNGILYKFKGILDGNVIYSPIYSDISDDKGVRYNANKKAKDIYEALVRKAQINGANKAQNSNPIKPKVLDDLSAAQQELAALGLQHQQRVSQLLSPLQQASKLENSLGGNLDNIDAMSNLDATKMEQEMGGALNSIESQQERNPMLDEYEKDHWQSQFEIIEEQQLQGFEESIPIMDQYPESDGEQSLGENICTTSGKAKNNISEIENIDLPDF